MQRRSFLQPEAECPPTVNMFPLEVVGVRPCARHAGVKILELKQGNIYHSIPLDAKDFHLGCDPLPASLAEIVP